jgi:alkylation response protein AidB-like acyl-CoA dehydrogenase
MIPNRYGGHQEDWETVAELIMEIARGDGSQAWVAAVLFAVLLNT